VRAIRYREIAADLRRRVEADEFGAGGVLPSESELSASYAASRVTVRKALEVLREERLVDARQGFGWFVAVDPLRQVLGRLGTIEAQLAASGARSERRVLDFGFVPAPPRAREVLGCDTVLEVRRVNLADDQPFALVTVWCPEELGSAFSRDDVAERPFYDLLEIEVGGATQSIGAALAGPADAADLAVPAGSPVLVCERITYDVNGRAVLCSAHVFPAHRTEFVVDLPAHGRSIAPSGLRLVDPSA
jgi:GntR family transcriptional regulator